MKRKENGLSGQSPPAGMKIARIKEHKRRGTKTKQVWKCGT